MQFAFTDEQAMIAETARGFFVEQATSARTRAAMAAVPEALGGAGLGLVELAILFEAAGAQIAALPMLGSLGLCGQALVHGGSSAQQAEWLPALLSGAQIAGYVHDAALTADGNMLTGASRFVAHGGAAGLFVVTNNAGAWLVRAGAAGLTVTPSVTMDQTRPYATVTLAGVAGEPLADPAAAISAANVPAECR